MKALLIIPAYNEEENIEKVVARIDEFKKSRCSGLQLDYVIINDGSTDDTLQICRKNNFNVVNLIQNLGIGGAVQTGYMYAERYGYDIAVQFDGDGQHLARFIPSMEKCAEEGKYGIVIASRYIEGKKGKSLREIGSRLKIKQTQQEKQDLLQSLQLYYQVFFLGEELE